MNEDELNELLHAVRRVLDRYDRQSDDRDKEQVIWRANNALESLALAIPKRKQK